MADRKRQQQVAFERWANLPPERIRCRFCGEQTASTAPFMGYVHRWGPTSHTFMAAKPGPRSAELQATDHDTLATEARTTER